MDINIDFSDVVITNNHKDTQSYTHLKINAQHYKWQVLSGHITSELKGDLFIGDEKYTFSLTELGETSSKYLFGVVEKGDKEKFYLYLFDNFKSIYLAEYTKFEYFIAAPASTSSDYLKIKAKLPR